MEDRSNKEENFDFENIQDCQLDEYKQLLIRLKNIKENVTLLENNIPSK